MQVPPFSLSDQISLLGNDLENAVLRVLRSGQYIGGPEVEAFEESFADILNVPYVVGCNSGTDALVLALRALDIGKGDEVITSAFSFFATAEAISEVEAKPVFVDVEIGSYLMDLDKVDHAITTRTKAILPVHLFGCPIDMERLNNIAKKNGLKVIEDCAQAAGAKWDNLPVGSLGDIGCFSFFPTKNLGAAGDAGAVATKDPILAKRMRELAIHGMPKRYIHSELGYNSRLDAIQAAVLNVKLVHMPNWIKKRQEVSEFYMHNLSGIEGIELPSQPMSKNAFHSWNQFVIRVSQKYDDLNVNSSPKSYLRDQLKINLEEEGVNTIIYYPVPIHMQPAYKKLEFISQGLEVTERICNEVLSLPIFPEITYEQQKFVVDKLREVLRKLNTIYL